MTNMCQSANQLPAFKSGSSKLNVHTVTSRVLSPHHDNILFSIRWVRVRLRDRKDSVWAARLTFTFSELEMTACFSSLSFWVGTRVVIFFSVGQPAKLDVCVFCFFSGGEQPEHVPSARLAWTSAYFKALPLKNIYILFKTKQNKTQCSWVDCALKLSNSTKNGHSEGRCFRSFWPLERKAIS